MKICDRCGEPAVDEVLIKSDDNHVDVCGGCREIVLQALRPIEQLYGGQLGGSMVDTTLGDPHSLSSRNDIPYPLPTTVLPTFKEGIPQSLVKEYKRRGPKPKIKV